MNVEGRYVVRGEEQSNEALLGWRSPAMGLLFGMASVLVLVGFAWIILVCIACRMVGANLGRNAMQVNLESIGSAHLKPEVTWCHDGEEEGNEKVLVIMPGDHKPTFLATQLSCGGHSTEKRGL